MTDFSFGITRDQGTVVLTVRGNVDLSRSIVLGAVLGDLIDGQGNLSVDVDLRDVSSVDPTGLGVFAVAARLAARRGGHLSLTGYSNPSWPTPDELKGRNDQHLVEFYAGDEFLAESVRVWLAPALLHHDVAVVVATDQHRRLFASALARAGVDVGRARAEGRYVELDAEDTLSRFMVGSVPEPGLFMEVIGGLVSRASSRRAVRIYGEMVAVLWKEGNVTAAMALEDLWNDLARSQEFSLLCGYPISSFDAKATGASFRAICNQHAASVGR